MNEILQPEQDLDLLKTGPDNELVVVDMQPSERLRLYSQITARMEMLGYTSLDYKKLDLGFELPVDWPAAEHSQPTLAELIAVAVKLKMRVIINNIYMEPYKSREGNKE